MRENGIPVTKATIPQVRQFLREFLARDWLPEEGGDPAPICPLLIGETGVGKTTLVREICEELGLPLVLFAIGNKEGPGDVLGIPKLEGERTIWRVTEELVPEDPRTVILLDEVTDCPPHMWSLLKTLLTSRSIGGSHRLPPTVKLVGTCNPWWSDKYSTNEPDAAVSARLSPKFLIEFDPDAWHQWLLARGVKLVPNGEETKERFLQMSAAISAAVELIDMSNPRTWTSALRVASIFEIGSESWQLAIDGFIPGGALPLLNYIELGGDKLPSWSEIRQDPLAALERIAKIDDLALAALAMRRLASYSVLLPIVDEDKDSPDRVKIIRRAIALRLPPELTYSLINAMQDNELVILYKKLGRDAHIAISKLRQEYKKRREQLLRQLAERAGGSRK